MTSITDRARAAYLRDLNDQRRQAVDTLDLRRKAEVELARIRTVALRDLLGDDAPDIKPGEEGVEVEGLLFQFAGDDYDRIRLLLACPSCHNLTIRSDVLTSLADVGRLIADPPGAERCSQCCTATYRAK